MQSKLNEVYMIKLRGEVASRFGAPISTPRDFEALADAIFNATGSTLSPSTLKRLWGYVKDTQRKHTSTLDILARYAGDSDAIFAKIPLENADVSSFEFYEDQFYFQMDRKR